MKPDLRNRRIGPAGILLIVLLMLAAAWNWWPVGDHVRLTPLATPAAADARLPRFAAIPGGGAILSWVEPDGDGHVLKFGVLRDGQWLRQGTVASGQGWFVNWSDFPSVVAVKGDFWVAHWLVSQPGGQVYDYDIALAVSSDAGRSWREIGPPHRDGTAAEHGFAVIFTDRDAAGIVWLDGREYFEPAQRAFNPGKSGNFALRFTRIFADGSMAPEQVLDDNTCTCCWPAVASLPTGSIVAWRGRTDGEIRDNRIAVLHDGAWSKPAGLGGEQWKIAGCPVNGPALAARENQVLAAWFTAADDRPRVRAALSADGGQSFAPAFDLDDRRPLGRIAALWLDDSHALVSWMAAPRDEKTSALVVRSIDRDGGTGSSIRLEALSAGRDSGVPQMLRDGARVYFAWTDKAPQFGIRAGYIPVSALLP
ncbi:hypothetical protein MTYP_00426 [Methylophilaceae bacterium]|nr:hypothetical protein MTYP_00426 [Methylophilaceae bacterium]